jgi:NADP-dependent 3-hydroxy acid dehydrogenase YdfG
MSRVATTATVTGAGAAFGGACSREQAEASATLPSATARQAIHDIESHLLIPVPRLVP